MKKSAGKRPAASGPRLWVVLARAYGALAEYLTGCIAAEGLCLSDFMVLEVLLHKGAMTISGIGEKVLLANASMTAAVDRLEERGFVVRQNAENDRRSRIVDLTPPGREFISALYARHARDIEAVMAVLSRKEREQLRSGLKTLGLAARAATERASGNAQRHVSVERKVKRSGKTQ